MREGFVRTLAAALALVAPGLTKWAAGEASPARFARVDRRCDACSQGRARDSQCLNSAAGLLVIVKVFSS